MLSVMGCGFCMVGLFFLRSFEFLEVLADTDHLPVETLHGVVDLSNRYARDLRNFAGFPIAVLHGPDDLGQLGISARLLNEPRQNAIIALCLFLLKQRCLGFV